MSVAKKIMITTLTLTLTSFLMKTITVWFNVYLTGIIGSVGIGIFQLILSIYALAKTLACGGMNLAATRMCIENYSNSRGIMTRLFAIALTLGCISCAILYFGAQEIALEWIHTQEATLSLKVLSVSLPFIALSASLNGYMTAARKMTRYSLIQFLEQISKIGITVLIIQNFESRETELAIALVSFGITISEMISFFLAWVAYIWDVHKLKLRFGTINEFWRRTIRLIIPDAIGSYVRSGLNTVEHLLIPIGIRKTGQCVERAFSDYGAIQGMALPIILYPSSVFSVLSSLLVPEIAECKLKERNTQINYMIHRVLSIALIFSIGTMAVIWIFSDELATSIYSDGTAGMFIQKLAPLIPIMYLDMTTDGILKGLDQQYTIMKINVLDSILCVVLVWWLVPYFAAEGFILTIYVAEIVNFICSFLKLSSIAKIRLKLTQHILKPCVCALCSIQFAKKCLSITEKPTLSMIIAISVGLILYYIMLRIVGSITKEDSLWLKKLISTKKATP